MVDRSGRGGRSPAGSISLFALALVCFIGLSCGPLSSRIIYNPKPGSERFELGETTLKAEVDELTSPLLKSGEATCLEIGVLLPDGSSHAYGYGRVSDTGTASLPNANTVFQIGSVSKLFTAALLERLVQEGSISYSDTIRDIMPSNVILSADIGKITIYELATNTSGLPREPVTFKQFLYFMKYQVTGKNLYGYINKSWLYGFLKTEKIKNKSNKFIYSNIGYGLLAHLIEVKLGKPFPELVADKLFSPLAMRDTVFSLSQQQRERQANGHVGDQPYLVRRNTPMKSWDMGEIMAPSGGIYSTVSDLLSYTKHTFASDGLPLTSSLHRTTEPKVQQNDGDMAGLGWAIADIGSDHTIVTYKHGMASGYTAYVGMDISKKIAVIVLCSSFNWNDKIGHNLLLRISHASGHVNEQKYP